LLKTESRVQLLHPLVEAEHLAAEFPHGQIIEATFQSQIFQDLGCASRRGGVLSDRIPKNI